MCIEVRRKTIRSPRGEIDRTNDDLCRCNVRPNNRHRLLMIGLGVHLFSPTKAARLDRAGRKA